MNIITLYLNKIQTSVAIRNQYILIPILNKISTSEELLTIIANIRNHEWEAIFMYRVW